MWETVPIQFGDGNGLLKTIVMQQALTRSVAKHQTSYRVKNRYKGN